jgi:hypothetical protein
MAGFECSTHINCVGERLDMTASVEHDLFCAEDYRRLRDLGILAARDGLRWHRIDRGGSYDWSSWTPMLNAAREEGVQVIWDLFHYGWPDNIDIFTQKFVDRFGKFAREAARIHREHSDEIPFFSPFNEISFFSWAAARELIFPWAHGRDGELKRQAVRAFIAAVDNVRDVDPRARFISPEPLIHNVPPVLQPWNTGPALAQRNSQWEAWDMIRGVAAPELGGHERYLDIIGLNFYAANEWEVPGGRKLHWDAGSDDPRWMPLHQLLAEVHERYRQPFFIAETSHYGVGRAPWLNEIAAEVAIALKHDVPVGGVCLYPILDRFDWDDSSHWHNCGLWDLEKDPDHHFRRAIDQRYALALRTAQTTV